MIHYRETRSAHYELIVGNPLFPHYRAQDNVAHARRVVAASGQKTLILLAIEDIPKRQ